MNRKALSLFVILSILLGACGLLPESETNSPVAPVVTEAPLATEEAQTEQPSAAPTQPAGQPAVVTATGMVDIGPVLGKQEMTAVPGKEIDWDHLKKMSDWKEDKGLTDVQVLYVQSGTPNEITLPKLEGQDTFVVPDGTTLIFGAYYGSVTLGNGKSYAYDKGFYGALTEGTVVKSMTLRDGFALLIGRDYAKAEYCARIAQAKNEKWSMDHLYRPTAWADPVCEGTITTPLDDDR